MARDSVFTNRHIYSGQAGASTFPLLFPEMVPFCSGFPDCQSKGPKHLPSTWKLTVIVPLQKFPLKQAKNSQAKGKITDCIFRQYNIISLILWMKKLRSKEVKWLCCQAVELVNTKLSRRSSLSFISLKPCVEKSLLIISLDTTYFITCALFRNKLVALNNYISGKNKLWKIIFCSQHFLFFLVPCMVPSPGGRNTNAASPGAWTSGSHCST